MSFFDNFNNRIKASIDVFKNGYTFIPVKQQHKEAPFIWPDFRNGKPEWQLVDLQSYINEGFNLNSLIYSAIMYKVRAASLAPLRAYTGDFDNPELLPMRHDLAKLIYRPNPNQSWVEFQSLNIVYENIAGNCYIFLDRARKDMLPQAMYSLRPDRVYIVPEKKGNKSGLKGYLYVPEGERLQDGLPILPQDMIHIKLPNPSDPLEGLGYGLSPISSIARSADVDNSITHFLNLFFKQGAMVTGILKFNVPLEDSVIKRIRARWKEVYGGYQNWDIGVLDNAGDYEKIGLTFDEMGFSDLDARNESRISGPFGVPLILIGAKLGIEHGTYSNFEEARKQFWEDTLVPENKLFLSDYQYYLQTEDGGFVDYDYSEVPALQKDITNQVAAWKELVDRGVNREDAAETVGLRLVLKRTIEEEEAIGIEDESTDETNVGAIEAESDDRKQLPKIEKPVNSFNVKSFAEKADKLAQSWEDKFREAGKRAFETDKREILAIMSDAKKKSLQYKETIRWYDVGNDILIYMQDKSESQWRDEFQPVIKGIIDEQADNLIQMGINFNLENIYAGQWFDDYMLVFAQPINQTTSSAISTFLKDAETNGWTFEQARNHLETLFKQWMNGDLSASDFEWFSDRLPLYRLELIVRTETLRSLNAGNFHIYGMSNVSLKAWIGTPDNRIRPTHEQADKDYNPDSGGTAIRVNEYFQVGSSKMLYPGDPNGSIEECANCRCSIAPIMLT
jgi:HK97 family phage portal protein